MERPASRTAIRSALRQALRSSGAPTVLPNTLIADTILADSAGSVSSHSVNHFINGLTTGLVVVVSLQRANSLAAGSISLTVGGQAAAKQSEAVTISSNADHIAVFTLANPPTGNQTLTHVATDIAGACSFVVFEFKAFDLTDAVYATHANSYSGATTYNAAFAWNPVAGDKAYAVAEMGRDSTGAAVVTPPAGWTLGDQVLAPSSGGARNIGLTSIASIDTAISPEPNSWNFTGLDNISVADYVYAGFSLKKS